MTNDIINHACVKGTQRGRFRGFLDSLHVGFDVLEGLWKLHVFPSMSCLVSPFICICCSTDTLNQYI